eukprot:696025-Rhodomonas_salina.4
MPSHRISRQHPIPAKQQTASVVRATTRAAPSDMSTHTHVSSVSNISRLHAAAPATQKGSISANQQPFRHAPCTCLRAMRCDAL